MPSEIEFTKYKTCGAGYHWDDNSYHPKKMNAFVKARYQKCIQLLADKLGSCKDKKIIDLGCGDGVLTYQLFKYKAESYGVDLSEDAIQFARQKHNSLGSNARFFIESCTDTHFEDGYFDAAISSDVIEHLNNPGELLIEIQRLLKPNGVAIISTPIRFTEYPLDTLHTIEWFKDEFQTLIKNTFTQAAFEYSHPLFWYELTNRGGKYKIGVNILSYFKNPFLTIGKWKFPCMQYAIIIKT